MLTSLLSTLNFHQLLSDIQTARTAQTAKIATSIESALQSKRTPKELSAELIPKFGYSVRVGVTIKYTYPFLNRLFSGFRYENMITLFPIETASCVSKYSKSQKESVTR